ncbi:hypothetical protein HK102_014166 [Quaeritorhiza haematococci]|nr:hypothetical protein HK102_014166 [Quaeritorhiza haematococci]
MAVEGDVVVGPTNKSLVSVPTSPEAAMESQSPTPCSSTTATSFFSPVSSLASLTPSSATATATSSQSPLTAASPSHGASGRPQSQQSQLSENSPLQEEKKKVYIPAPPPAVNVWKVRMEAKAAADAASDVNKSSSPLRATTETNEVESAAVASKTSEDAQSPQRKQSGNGSGKGQRGNRNGSERRSDREGRGERRERRYHPRGDGDQRERERGDHHGYKAERDAAIRDALTAKEKEEREQEENDAADGFVKVVSRASKKHAQQQQQGRYRSGREREWRRRSSGGNKDHSEKDGKEGKDSAKDAKVANEGKELMKDAKPATPTEAGALAQEKAGSSPAKTVRKVASSPAKIVHVNVRSERFLPPSLLKTATPTAAQMIAAKSGIVSSTVAPTEAGKAQWPKPSTAASSAINRSGTPPPSGAATAPVTPTLPSSAAKPPVVTNPQNKKPVTAVIPSSVSFPNATATTPRASAAAVVKGVSATSTVVSVSHTSGVSRNLDSPSWPSLGAAVTATAENVGTNMYAARKEEYKEKTDEKTAKIPKPALIKDRKTPASTNKAKVTTNAPIAAVPATPPPSNDTIKAGAPKKSPWAKVDVPRPVTLSAAAPATSSSDAPATATFAAPAGAAASAPQQPLQPAQSNQHNKNNNLKGSGPRTYGKKQGSSSGSAATHTATATAAVSAAAAALSAANAPITTTTAAPVAPVLFRGNNANRLNSNAGGVAIQRSNSGPSAVNMNEAGANPGMMPNMNLVPSRGGVAGRGGRGGHSGGRGGMGENMGRNNAGGMHRSGAAGGSQNLLPSSSNSTRGNVRGNRDYYNNQSGAGGFYENAAAAAAAPAQGVQYVSNAAGAGAAGVPVPMQAHLQQIDLELVDIDAIKWWIRCQIEYYFSIENLCRDIYFRRQMDPATGYVPLRMVANFNRVRTLIDMARTKVNATKNPQAAIGSPKDFAWVLELVMAALVGSEVVDISTTATATGATAESKKEGGDVAAADVAAKTEITAAPTASSSQGPLIRRKDGWEYWVIGSNLPAAGTVRTHHQSNNVNNPGPYPYYPYAPYGNGPHSHHHWQHQHQHQHGGYQQHQAYVEAEGVDNAEPTVGAKVANQALACETAEDGGAKWETAHSRRRHSHHQQQHHQQCKPANQQQHQHYQQDRPPMGPGCANSGNKGPVKSMGNGRGQGASQASSGKSQGPLYHNPGGRGAASSGMRH